MAHGCYRQTTDRRQTTDGRAIAYSEREREFTFAKNDEQRTNAGIAAAAPALNRLHAQRKIQTCKIKNHHEDIFSN